MRALRCLAFVFAALPAIALADIAALTRGETQVFAAPTPGAEVIAVLPAQTEVLVYELPVNGYRQVQLEDGRHGYLNEAALFQTPSVPTSPGTPAPPTLSAATRFGLISATYVESPMQLRALTRSDPLVFERADDISRRYTRAVASAAVGGAIGLTLGLLGIFLPHDRCYLESMGSQGCTYGVDQIAVAGVGATLVVASVLSYFWLGPRTSEMREAILLWNHRHPEQLLRFLP